MAKRVCLEPGCPVIVTTGRCRKHRSDRELLRGTRQERGYDANHDRLRARWQRRLDAGEVVWCWRCLLNGTRTRIDPKAWDLGHQDDDRSRYAGPECRACNRATAGRISQGA